MFQSLITFALQYELTIHLHACYDAMLGRDTLGYDEYQ